MLLKLLVAYEILRSGGEWLTNQLFQLCKANGRVYPFRFLKREGGTDL